MRNADSAAARGAGTTLAESAHGSLPPPPPLIPVGGPRSQGLRGCPSIAAREEMVLQLLHLAARCQGTWLNRLHAPVRLWQAIGDHFLMTGVPRPLGRAGGGGGLPPYGRQPCTTPAHGVLLAAPQAHRGQGRGTLGARCLDHSDPSCDSIRLVWYGSSRCC